MRLNVMMCSGFKTFGYVFVLMVSIVLTGPAFADNERRGLDLIGTGQTQAAVKAWQRGVEHGDAGAAYRLGVYYLSDAGGARDVHKALTLLDKSAQMGDPRAELAMGQIYDQGELVDRDAGLAAAMFSRAAEKGLVAAQFAYAQKLELGDGVPRDQETAYMYYLLSMKDNFATPALAGINRLEQKLTKPSKDAAVRAARDFVSKSY
ncbi:MAG: tetratricopeptide repeat protein [Parvibaculales bacterium]